MVGFSPTRPERAAGARIEPPVSVPKAAGASPKATAAGAAAGTAGQAAVVIGVDGGAVGRVLARCSVGKGVQVVLEADGAGLQHPFNQEGIAGGDVVGKAREPPAVATPAMSMRSFELKGIPCKGDWAPAVRASYRRAAFIAASAETPKARATLL